jgi:hypothetical protein
VCDGNACQTPLFFFADFPRTEKKEPEIVNHKIRLSSQNAEAVLRILNFSISHIFLSVKGKDNIRNVEDNSTLVLKPQHKYNLKAAFLIKRSKKSLLFAVRLRNITQSA